MVEVSDLKGIDLFSTFSDRQLQQIAKITRKRSHRIHAVVYHKDQPAEEVFVVVKGLVSLRSPETKDQLATAFELCEPGDIFGTASLMKHSLYTLTAVCVEETHLLALDAHKLLKLCEVDFELGYKLMRKVARLYFDRHETAKKELGIPVTAN